MTLDPAQDPDRYDPARDAGAQEAAPGPLDPAADPDRYRAPTLPGLLGEGAYEDERDTLTWLFGLLGVLAFLGLVAFLVTVLSG
jgi:hypothetical protein